MRSLSSLILCHLRGEMPPTPKMHQTSNAFLYFHDVPDANALRIHLSYPELSTRGM